jgi:hypothetical protein
MAHRGATLNTLHVDRNNLRQWPLDATEGLIRRRRLYHDQFRTTAIQRQRELWIRISNYIYNEYHFDVTAAQCRTKWNSLISGYENLNRLLRDNPRRLPTHTPSIYDQRFHNELSDEFWLIASNYLIN